MATRKDCVEYHDDGTIEIFGNKDGMPRVTAVCPAPDINTPTEEERVKRHNGACNGLYLRGFFIESRRRIRNEGFDDPGQKTSLEVVYRPCKNESETKEVLAEIQRIIREASRIAPPNDEDGVKA